MFTVPVKYVDLLNIILILITCTLAHVFPYHLLIFSYAVLGPAHYLTQISWLHDRRYFANSNFIAPALVTLSIVLLIMSLSAGTYTILSAAIVFSIAFWLAIMFTLPVDKIFYHSIAVAFGIFMIWLVTHSLNSALFMAIMLPTVMHVFVFTVAFMWLGAMKNHNLMAYLSVIAMLICAGTFFIPITSSTAAPNLTGIVFFKPVIIFLQKISGLSNASEAQLFGFLSYAYTYHYLNWFSKAEVIHWNRIPRQRMQAIIVIYVIALLIYAYNYTVGFLIILLLSQLHVLMEFPLNLRTFVALVRGRG